MIDSRMAFVLLYAADVREYPEAYKTHVRAAPEDAGLALTDGLSETECRAMLNDLRAERRQVRRITGS